MLPILYSTWPPVSASSTSTAVTVPVHEKWPDVGSRGGTRVYAKHTGRT